MRNAFLGTLVLIVLALACESKPPTGPGVVTITESTTSIETTSIPIPTVAAFTVSPQSPEVLQMANFDGTESKAPPGRTITRYDWDFGEGTSGSGVKTTKAYAISGTYLVTLTVTDSQGQQGRLSQPITVKPVASPTTASFTVSPVSPEVGQPVTFNAAASAPAPGRTIVGYAWDFGDQSVASGDRPTHTYTRAAAYVVTLVVTDSQGQRATASQPVVVRTP
jgi:PKD repeat protein